MSRSFVLDKKSSFLGIAFLYKDAMSLVAEATKYLSQQGRFDKETLPNHLKVVYEKESVHLTTRLMHIASWFLFVRALNAGEMPAKKVWAETKKIDLAVGSSVVDNCALSAALPPSFFQFIQDSLFLQERVSRFDREIRESMTDEAVICFKNSVSEQMRLLETSFQAMRL